MQDCFNYTDHCEVPDVQLQLVSDCADKHPHELSIEEINEFMRGIHPRKQRRLRLKSQMKYILRVKTLRIL